MLTFEGCLAIEDLKCNANAVRLFSETSYVKKKVQKLTSKAVYTPRPHSMSKRFNHKTRRPFHTLLTQSDKVHYRPH